MALEGDRWTHGSHCGYRGAPGVPMPRTPKPSHHPPCPVIPLPGRPLGSAALAGRLAKGPESQRGQLEDKPCPLPHCWDRRTDIEGRPSALSFHPREMRAVLQ